VFAHGYARAYCGGSPRTLQLVDPWLAVHAAARLSEGIEVERPTLTGLLQRASRKATR
jgi:hypothetical protein